MWMIRGSPRTPDRLPKLCGSCVQQSEVYETITGICGPHNLGGSATQNLVDRLYGTVRLLQSSKRRPRQLGSHDPIGKLPKCSMGLHHATAGNTLQGPGANQQEDLGHIILQTRSTVGRGVDRMPVFLSMRRNR